MKKRIKTAVVLAAATTWLALGCGLDLGAPPSPPVPLGPAVALLDIDGSMPTFPSSESFFSPGATNQRRLEKNLARAAADLQVQEVLLHIGAPQISWARADEIASAIARVAAAGKPVTCHIDDVDNLGYYLAAKGCPRIVVSPAGSVELIGLSLEAVYLREMLASIGVTADMLHVGKYKDAAEPLTSDAMSPEARESAESLLDDLSRLFKEGVAAGRKLDAAKVQALVDGGPYGAADAKAKGLVDDVGTLGALVSAYKERYAGGVIDDYGKEPAKPFSLADILKLFGGQGEAAANTATPRVALIPVVGPIDSGSGDDLFAGTEVVRDMQLVFALDKALRDDSVKAVVLRIDSPGGSALASDNIWVAVRALAAKKPVVASMGDVAASGGYYIASAATEILASPATLTGSVGVVGGKIVLEGALAKLGVKTETINRGSRASLSSPFRPFTDDERQVVMKLMQSAYDLFVDRVVEGRKLDRKLVLGAAEGRVWTGSQAKERKLVDRLGGLADAVARARELGKLPAGAPVELFPKPKTFFELLGEKLTEPEAMSAVRYVPAGRKALSLVSLFLGEKVLAFAPVLFEVR
ncbi:MAG: signal peptide peptidase SppA [Deltaproteobacteria bacterium]|nr:signal peptide peptidase SppA [Deltaproteobacteria bacterium]